MKLLIGICGRARHGKDSTALAIKQRLELQGVSCFHSSVSVMVFEEAQRTCRIPSNISREQCTRQDLDTLVALGHEKRAFNPNYWISRLWSRITCSDALVAIVPGIRFDNEVNWVKKIENGVLLRVIRYNADGSMFISPDRDPNDVMETILNRVNPDFEISVKTGQENWLHWQGVSFANFILENYLKEDTHVPYGFTGTVTSPAVVR